MHSRSSLQSETLDLIIVADDEALTWLRSGDHGAGELASQVVRTIVAELITESRL
jgi:hypothetical protein